MTIDQLIYQLKDIHYEDRGICYTCDIPYPCTTVRVIEEFESELEEQS